MNPTANRGPRRPPGGCGRGGLRPGARRTLAAILIALTLGAAALAQDYHPHRAGQSMTYTNGETQVLSGPRDFGGQQVMVLTHYHQGDAISEDYLVYAPQGVLQVGWAAGGTVMTYSPPLLAFAAGPYQIGTQWQSTTSLSGVTITLSAEVLAMRGVDTPAGRFNAFQIRQVTVTATGGQTVLDAYFVPGVGVVRYVMQDGTVINLLEYSL